MGAELGLVAGNGAELRVLEYLEGNARAALAEKIRSGKKTLAGAMAYAAGEARKSGGGCVCVDDATVFGWVTHYFEEDDVREKSRPAVRAPAGVETCGGGDAGGDESDDDEEETPNERRAGKARSEKGRGAQDPRQMSLAELMAGMGGGK